MIIFLLTIIAVELTGACVWAALQWHKIDAYLTWNTRYESLDYEREITTPKLKKPKAEPSITTKNGKTIVPTDDLVDLSDLDFETAVKAVEELGT
jgi:hypothetical protein